MDKQQKTKIALFVLIAVMAFVWGPIIFGSDKKDKDNNSKTNTNVGLNSKTSSTELIKLSHFGMRDKARTTFSEWGQNPFILTLPPKALVVEGIFYDVNNPQVIINGEMLGVGGLSGPNSIVEIKPNSVVIKSKSGEVVELQLGEEKQF